MSPIEAETAAVIGTVVGAGGIGGWIRERRKGRKDANQFAMEFIKAQSIRIDELVREVAELRADNKVHTMTYDALTRENQELRVERDKDRAEKIHLSSEIDRLRTELLKIEIHNQNEGGQA